VINAYVAHAKKFEGWPQDEVSRQDSRFASRDLHSVHRTTWSAKLNAIRGFSGDYQEAAASVLFVRT
jgi:hypothetical protein